MSNHLQLGAAGESAAAGWYRHHGFRVVARNWRGRNGEIDLVLRSGDLLVFSEVKTRRSDRFGGGAAAVGPAKQRRLRGAAMEFLATVERAEHLRFDVAVVRPTPHGFAVEVLAGAF